MHSDADVDALYSALEILGAPVDLLRKARSWGAAAVLREWWLEVRAVAADMELCGITEPSGRHYAVHSDGTVTGFANGSVVTINRNPLWRGYETTTFRAEARSAKSPEAGSGQCHTAAAPQSLPEAHPEAPGVGSAGKS